MKYIRLDNPPASCPSDLSAWLNRVVADINEAIKQIHDFEPQTQMPPNNLAGQVLFFEQTFVSAGITSIGWWGYNGTNWVKLG